MVHPFGLKISAWCAIVYRALSKHERNKLAMAIFVNGFEVRMWRGFFFLVEPQEQTKTMHTYTIYIIHIIYIYVYTLTESDFVFNLSTLYIGFHLSLSLTTSVSIFGCFVKFFSFEKHKGKCQFNVQTIVRWWSYRLNGLWFSFILSFFFFRFFECSNCLLCRTRLWVLSFVQLGNWWEISVHWWNCMVFVTIQEHNNSSLFLCKENDDVVNIRTSDAEIK